MSCPDSNAPIDIDIQKVAGKCDLKCAYNFKYPKSSCVATNRGDYISIAYDTMSTPPVTYNTIRYNVSEVRIYSPSIHTFNGQKAVGEMIIIHNSMRGGHPLLVCVPLTNDNSDTKGSSLLTEIIQAVSSNAPADGETTTITLDDFTLDEFVPNKPFFAYNATQPYQPCVGKVDIIVFGPRESKKFISSDALTSLNSIIHANTYTTKTGPLLFFNAKGPGSNGIGEDIYIDCQPVDKSEDTTKISKNKSTCSSTSTPDIDIDSIMNNPTFQTIMGSFIFILIILMFSALIKVVGQTTNTTTTSVSVKK